MPPLLSVATALAITATLLLLLLLTVTATLTFLLTLTLTVTATLTTVAALHRAGRGLGAACKIHSNHWTARHLLYSNAGFLS